jgi:GNAT superfamily N-acetyltransferase
MNGSVKVRVARAEDYDRIIAVVDEWWGRPVSSSLPRLFLDHFWSTSRIVEDEHGLAAFLIAFFSPSQPRLAYVHFVGVRPDHRGSGLARASGWTAATLPRCVGGLHRPGFWSAGPTA